MKLEQIQQVIPQPVNWVVFGVPIVSLFEVVNPVLQAVAFIVAIAWGAIQIYGFVERRRRKERSSR